jgi:hypothetical protein
MAKDRTIESSRATLWAGDNALRTTGGCANHARVAGWPVFEFEAADALDAVDGRGERVGGHEGEWAPAWLAAPTLTDRGDARAARSGHGSPRVRTRPSPIGADLDAAGGDRAAFSAGSERGSA